MEKIYIIRKYIKAKSAKDALKKEPRVPVDDIWTDEETHKEFLKEQMKSKIGYGK